MAPRWIIYCHTHVASGRRYVGLTKKTMLQRWNQHVYTSARLAKKGWSHFANAIRKYGKDAFSHEVLETCDTLEAANAAEGRWVIHFDTRNPEKGFNLAPGGQHVPHPVTDFWTDEKRASASESAKARWADPLYRARASAASKTALNRPDVKAKVSAAARASFADPDVKARLSDSMRRSFAENPNRRAAVSESAKERGISPQTRLAASIVNTGRPISPDVRKKISFALTGRKLSPEHAAKGRQRPSLRKDFCIRGHDMSLARSRSDGHRYCRICASARQKERRSLTK